MKKTTLLLKLQNFFSPELKQNKATAKELKIILRKLKKKERSLIDLVNQVKDSDLQKLYQTELEIIRIQRKKGLAALQNIREKLKLKN